MTFAEFIKKYEGQEVDFDGWYGTQCMDLMHQYVYDVLGHTDATILAAPSAKLAYENFYRDDLFRKIDNSPTGLPEEGDIIFWDGGEWGHVAIFMNGTLNDFTSFDANYPTGTLPHEQYHTYYNVVGWLRPIKQDYELSLKDTQIDWHDPEGNSHEVGWYVREWWIEKKNGVKQAEEIGEKNKNYERLQETLAEINQINTTLTQDKARMQKTIDNMTEINEKLISENSTLRKGTLTAQKQKEAVESLLRVQEGLVRSLKAKSQQNLRKYTFWEFIKAKFTKKKG